MTGQQQQQQWGNNAARAAPAPAMGGNMMWSQPAAQSWSMASYAAPSSSWENSWSNGMNGNGGGAMWYPAPAAAAERVTAESAAGRQEAIIVFQVFGEKVKNVNHLETNVDPELQVSSLI